MKKSLFLLLVLISVVACKSTKEITTPLKDDGMITFKFIQLNDVYEIAPLSGGKYGGMARVAHVVDSVKQVEPNTFLFMAGDFLNPSLLGTIKYEGERIKGKQMVEVMNAMDFELVTFGNHEFDVGEEALQKRLNESNFYWTSANCFQQLEDGPRSFYFERGGDSIYVPETYTLSLMDKDSTQLDVGFFGVTLPSNPQDFVYYADIFLEAGSAYSKLQMQQSDLIVGLTHLEIEQDKELAERFPGISFIMGGHEHNNMLVEAGNAKIAKADANAKTIYIHTLTFNKNTQSLTIDSHLFPIDETIAEKPSVKAIVNKWEVVLDNEIKQVVDNPNEVIYISQTPLDGTDSASRGIQTNLGDMITRAMAVSFETPVNAALVNGGSIRIDDMLANQVTSMDIFRVLPFGGSVLKVAIKGSLLKEVLDYGKSQRGEGAYLQRYNFQQNTKGEWFLEGNAIENDKVYQVAFSDFLLKGYDIPFLTPENEGILKVYQPAEYEPAKDIRKAIIIYLKKLKK
ncbi:MAG: bifunctional metallophosphatase/5'-nucleotidase [Flavobacteriaceae bacterium]|nr:bifunctional metallophosphatase/5'-nucleotidase [Flavobacteriaceae bacterium]|tara:strand:+ start:15044 stop:16582 length:1539 start_codon:yes stop_codon:yes gene_type:complete